MRSMQRRAAGAPFPQPGENLAVVERIAPASDHVEQFRGGAEPFQSGVELGRDLLPNVPIVRHRRGIPGTRRSCLQSGMTLTLR